MKKLISLLKAAMSQDMSIFKRSNKKNESRIKKVIFPIFLACILMFSVGVYAQIFAFELSKIGLTYIVLTLFFIITSLITFLEGIYKSQGILFEGRDNDLLFSLPISKSKIFIVRIFKMLSFQYIYNLLFILPPVALYAFYERPNISFYFISLLMTFILPIIPTILACVLGYIVKGISTRFKSKRMLQTLLSLVLFTVIYYFSFKMQDLVGNLIENAKNINEILIKIYYPVGAYINLIQNFKVSDLLNLLLINIIPLILFVLAGSKFYFNIISKSRETRSVNKKIKDKQIKVTSKIKALISKELKRFFSSPVYIMNTLFGVVLLLIFTIMSCVKVDEVLNVINQDNNFTKEMLIAYLPKIFYGFVIFMSCMSSITSSSISLEGKSFNLTKSLPIKEKTLILSKILVSDILIIPGILICDVILFIFFKIAIVDMILIILASILMPNLIAIIGLIINFKYPKMNASNDTEVVKQSTSSMVAIFLGMGIGVISTFLMFQFNQVLELFMFYELIVILLLSVVLWNRLKKYGKKRIKEINV